METLNEKIVRLYFQGRDAGWCLTDNIAKIVSLTGEKPETIEGVINDHLSQTNCK